MSESMQERVRRGAALLDQHRAEWAEKIDLDRLSMSSRCGCVLGQLHHGSYVVGLNEVGETWRRCDRPDWGDRLFGFAHGFNLDNSIYPKDAGPTAMRMAEERAWQQLRFWWVRAIHERLAATRNRLRDQLEMLNAVRDMIRHDHKHGLASDELLADELAVFDAEEEVIRGRIADLDAAASER